MLGDEWDGRRRCWRAVTDSLSLMKDYVEKAQAVGQHQGNSANSKATRTGRQGTIDRSARDDRGAANERRDQGKDFPSLVKAAAGIASAQMRNMGTVAGELCQRPRCWYFPGVDFGLLAQDAEGKSLVPGGENKYHAIFGNDGPAYFVSPSSLAPALIALGATATFTGPGWFAQDCITVANFFLTPGSASEREHALKPNEILTRITIPAASHGLNNATYEVRQREMLDWPLVTASVSFKLDGLRR